MTKTTLIDFPCDFPVKIIGMNSETLINDVQRIVSKHFPGHTDERITYKKSENSNYLAITVSFLATNQEMLDEFYKEVSKLPEVKMVL